ncbi:MAG: acyl-CoA dehydratase activase [Candidatus Thorarchaeota archaeon]
MTGHLAVGIDAGSTTTKGVVIDHDERLVASSVVPTAGSVANAVSRVLSQLSAMSSLDMAEAVVVTTGYGRASTGLRGRQVTEITCHSIGVHHLNPDIRLVIDVGGQDAKVIRIGANGFPVDFDINDKCSAGTGRFLEVMARVLGVTIDELGPLALRSESPCPISSTCTVFAESEVVGRIGSGTSPADIAAGVHQAMSSKIASLSRRLGPAGPVALTGGVALNPAFRHYLSLNLGIETWVPEHPQLTGAIGAAVLAAREGG